MISGTWNTNPNTFPHGHIVSAALRSRGGQFEEMVGKRRNKSELSSKFDLCILLDPQLILLKQFKLNYSLIVSIISYNYAKTNLMLHAYSIHLFEKTCDTSELEQSHKRVFTVMIEKRRVLYD